MKTAYTTILASIALLSGCQPHSPEADNVVTATPDQVTTCRTEFYATKTKDDFTNENVHFFAHCMEIGALGEEEYLSHLGDIRKSEMAAGRL